MEPTTQTNPAPVANSPAPGQGGGAQPAPTQSQPTTAQKLWGSQGPAQQTVATSQPTPAQATQPTTQAPPPVAQPGVVAVQTAGQPVVATPPKNVVEMTAEMLKATVQEAFKAGQPAAVQPTPTQEDFEKMFNVVKPTKEQWQAIRGDDEVAALGAFTAMLQGAVKQAATIASYQMAAELDQVRQQFNPALTLAQERETEKMKSEFVDKYPDLKGMDPLLYQIRDQLVLQKKQFASKEEAFETVAKMARDLLTQIPQLRGGVQTTTNGAPAPQQQQASAMPTLSGRGTSGAGDSGGGSSGVNTAKRIFGGSR